MKKIITDKLLNNFKFYMQEVEKSPATIKKYICDVRKLQILFQYIRNPFTGKSIPVRVACPAHFCVLPLAV